MVAYSEEDGGCDVVAYLTEEDEICKLDTWYMVEAGEII